MPSVSALSRTVSGPIGLHEGSKELPLVETMELIEPRREKTVPNHLLETKIYSKVSQNACVLAKPAIIHFGGFEVDKKHVQSLQIVNASTEVIRMHIIPPQSKYFYIKYKKTERLVPGLTIDCTIEFSPDEWRYYYDCIRINCPGEENLVIPIHAYPVMSTKDFPTQFNFPPVPVGHKMTQLFPLRCEGPVDFEYQLIYVQPHPSFTVHPMSGIIPAHGQTEVSVTFAPLEFQTALMKIQLTISQFNSQPIMCTFSGVSTPGLLKEISMQSQGIVDNILDPRCLSPLDRSREKKKSFKIKSKGSQQTPQIQEVEYNGVRFPPKLDTPYAVAQVLNQEPGKLRAKDLRDTVLAQKQSTNKPATRQMKEAMFEHKVRQNVYEERQNQLRWQVKLGDDQITNSARAKILEERDQSWNEYKYDRRGDPVIEEEYKRTETKCTFRRTFRDNTDLAPETAMFDTYSNDLWATRHAALGKFAQAARKVIIHLRANWKIKVLKKVVQDILEQERNVETRTALLEKKEKEEEMELIPHDIQITANKIKKYTFPTYVPPNVKDDMAPDALGKVPYKPSEVVVKRKVPYFNLKVPKHYTLLGYNKHLVHEASRGYVAPKLARPLRTGAEDESIRITVPTEEIEVVAVDSGEEDVTQEVTREGSAVKKPQPLVALVPPKALFQPIEYPSLHIFNPAPGLQVFQAPVPYSETDTDFHLCPIPTYFKKDFATNPHSATQRRYLDREDVVRGIMGWKKFPSQGLTSLANTPTLTSVWVPRWDDQFGSDLLPEEVPVLLDQLPEDDRQNIEEEENENFTQSSEMILTPDMVSAQFAIIDPKVPTEEKVAPDTFPHGNKLPSTNIPVSTYGPVPREKREEELEFFMTKKYNRLGSKIQTKNTTLSNSVTDPSLLLK
ncbi:cilia- and flagella-associated protein 221-like [Saccostrea echinata]|uniref:cilia- and flagella-associated protein 221-like n=1 Tax=Saccostrea echinata TaxID=191078 RepID=UPI002A7EB697|nr:cilia- and flagella-associated protein 221-like [Saccostrea echinata]